MHKLLAVFLPPTGQVKKRAVLDLLGGMRRQGLRYAKSSTPPQASDMLHVMALAKPFSADRLAGFDDAGVLAGGDGGRGAVSHVADVMRKADKYCRRGLSELSRLRLEAGAPVSRDITRREAEVSGRRCWCWSCCFMLLLLSKPQVVLVSVAYSLPVICHLE